MMKSPSDGIKFVTTELQMQECAKHGITLPTKEVVDESTINIVICPTADTPTRFTDNEYGECSECGVKIMFRPTAPKGPQKVCIACGFGLALEELCEK